MDPFADLIVFDAVDGLSSTLKASELLDIPQSSVSRRYRSFANSLRLELSRKNGSYKVIYGNCILQQMRQLSQRFRFLHQLNRWSAQPALLRWLDQSLPRLPGQLLNLPNEYWDHWLEHRLVDQILECSLQFSSSIVEQNKPRRSLVLLAETPLRDDRLNPSIRPKLMLDAWAEVAGLTEVVQQKDWQIAPPHQKQETVATVKALPKEHISATSAHEHQIIAEVHLSWRYGPMRQRLDPAAEIELKQFERLIENHLGFGSEPQMEARHSFAPLDLDFIELG